MAIKNPKDYEIVGIFGNRQGILRKVTPKYFMATDGTKYLRDIVGGQWFIRKRGK